VVVTATTTTIIIGTINPAAMAVRGRDMHGHHHHRRREAFREETNGERTTTRVQLEMPPQAMERLQRLKEKTEAASYAEVIRSALRLFEALVEEHEKGSQFALKRADGETITYRIFV
jgi:Arc/MetJ-type ribon-helix-helix transcriptional regulator